MTTIRQRWTRAIALMTQSGGPWGGSGGGDSGGGSNGGGGDPKNPWSMPPGGGKRPRGPNNPRGPSALDEFMRQFNHLFGSKLPGSDNPGLWKKILISLGLLWLAVGSISRIAPEEQGVVTILGKYAFTLDPGLSFVPPWPIASVQKLNVKSNNKIDIAADKSERNFILTADQNIIDLGYQVRWNIYDAKKYAFQLSNPDITVREVGESAMREVLGNVSFIDALGNGRNLIETRVAARMQQLLNDYDSGVHIQGVSIMKASPPDQVRDAFNEVTAAQQNRQTSINNAKAYSQQIQSIAEGEASAFDRVYVQYKLAPEVTRRRMYYETMEQILARTNKTIVEPNAVAPYLPIGKSPSPPAVTVQETGR